MKLATIRITNLKLRTIIGIYDWERETKQDIVINITINYDARTAGVGDNIKDAIDYKAITKTIIKKVEGSSFFLLEKLAKTILDLVMDNHLIKDATVRVDKPLALRFADSVSVELSQKKLS